MATWCGGRATLACLLFAFSANVLQCVHAEQCSYPVAQPCQPCDLNGTCAVNCTDGGNKSVEELLEDFANGQGCTAGGNETCCTVYVPQSEHVITRDLYFGNKSLRLISLGVRDSTLDPTATLRCNFTATGLPPFCNPFFPEVYGVLPCVWGFTGSDQVYFEGIMMESCPGPVSIEGTTRVDVVNSRFRYFSDAVFDIFNSNEVRIDTSTFVNNIGQGMVDATYRGNTGAVAIGYHNLSGTVNPPPKVTVTNSNFTTNIAIVTDTLKATATRVLSSQSFKGRGAGMGIFMADSSNRVSVTIEGCMFKNNTSSHSGAGLYIAFDGVNTNHSATVSQSLFQDNNSGGRGGGLLLGFVSSGNPEAPMMARVSDCEFMGNNASSGGGVGAIPADVTTGAGVNIVLENCTFHRNNAVGFGGALRFAVFNTFSERDSIPDHQVINCTFTENSGPHGILGVAYLPITLSGTTRFENNIGSALRVISAVVTLAGEVEFVGNNAETHGGAAVHISSFGQLRMNRRSGMSFVNNTGNIGAAIYVDTQGTSFTYSELLFNPQCFLLYEDEQAPPVNWTDVFINFSGNAAVVGADIYATSLNTCSWFSFTAPFFGVDRLRDWAVFGGVDIDYQTDPVSVALTAGMNVSEITAVPGRSVSLVPQLSDQLGRDTVGTLELMYNPSSPPFNVQSEPSVLLVRPNDASTVSFVVTVPDSDMMEAASGEDIRGTLTALDLDRSGVAPDTVNLTMRACPPGQSLQRISSTSSTPGPVRLTCQCNNDALNHVVFCDEDGTFVILKLGFWAVYTGGILHGYSCPPGFCRCNVYDFAPFRNITCYPLYNDSRPANQCVCNRQGVLCGSCVEGTSVTAIYSHCETCHPAVGVVFIGIVVFAAVAMVLILVFNVKLPPWMFGLLFYIRMASYAGYYFPPTFEPVGRYLYFLSNLFSLYIPYDMCMPTSGALGSFAARYLPLYVALVVWPVTWLILKWKKQTYLWEGSVSLTALLLSHTLHTSMEILNCPWIVDNEGLYLPHWYNDGDLKCFHGGHAPLALLAIAVLVSCLALFVAITIIIFKEDVVIFKKEGSILNKKVIRELKPALTDHYFRDKYRWWMLVDFLRQVALISVIIIFPRSSIAPLIVLVIVAAAYGYCKPFKDRFSSLLEVFLLGALSLLIILSGNTYIVESLFRFSKVAGSSTVQGTCGDHLPGITNLSWLLLPFYYLPPIVATISIGIYLVWPYASKWVKRGVSQVRRRATKSQPENGNRAGSEAHPTVTVQEINTND